VSNWIGTSNQGFSPYAIEELRRVFTGSKFVQFQPGEVFQMTIPLENDEVLQALKTNEFIFLRHIQPVDREFPLQGSANDIQQLVEMIQYIESSVAHKKVAIHIRKSNVTSVDYTIAELKNALDQALIEAESTPVKQDPELIIAIYAHKDQLYVGFGTAEEMRSDWPGGAIRFQREEGQISRAKFKLLEAEQAFGLSFSQFSNALDIGAAPGGWTSLLLERGLQVTAIDPASLDERIVKHPSLIHLKKNASEVKLAKSSFDLLVCDMSWSPLQMSKLVNDLQYALKPYATGIITVKLMHKKGMQSIKDVKEKLSTSFHILQAKQLFHNREEITLFIQKKK